MYVRFGSFFTFAHVLNAPGSKFLRSRSTVNVQLDTCVLGSVNDVCEWDRHLCF